MCYNGVTEQEKAQKRKNEVKKMIKIENGKRHYFDKNEVEITEGCKIRYPDGSVKEVYLTEEYELGTDATNPVWVKNGWAFACDYGIYPLTESETYDVEVM